MIRARRCNRLLAQIHFCSSPRLISSCSCAALVDPFTESEHHQIINPSTSTSGSTIGGSRFSDFKVNNKPPHKFRNRKSRVHMRARELCENAMQKFPADISDPTVSGSTAMYSSIMGKLIQFGVCLDHVIKLDAYSYQTAYESLLFTFCYQEEYSDALQLFWRACAQGVFPTHFTYVSLVEGLCRENKWREGCDVFRIMMIIGIQPSVHLSMSLVRGLLKEGRTEDADYLCEDILFHGVNPSPSMCTWLVLTYCKSSKFDRAVDVLRKMHEMGCSSSVHAYNVIIHGYLKAGREDMASIILQKMGERGLSPDIVTYCISRMFSVVPKIKGKDPMMGLKILQAMVKNGFIDKQILSSCSASTEQEVELVCDQVIDCRIIPAEIAIDILIKEFCEEANVDVALYLLGQFLDRGLKPLVSSFNSVISCLVKGNQLRIAEMVMNHMDGQKASPNIVTYLIFINAYSKLGKTGSALLLFDEMVAKGLKPSVAIYDVLIGSLCKARRILEAECLFRSMVEEGVKPDAWVYTSMVNGYARIGKALEACALFEEMKVHGLHPSISTYCALINGLMKDNLFEEGCLYLQKMLEDGFLPDTAIYTILIDQFSRKGELVFACNLLYLMYRNEVMPNEKTFSSLISSVCKNMGHERTRDPRLRRRLMKAERTIFTLIPRKTVLSVHTFQASPAILRGNKEDVIKSIMRLVNHLGVQNDIYFYNVIIKWKCNKGLMRKAHSIVKLLTDEGIMPNIVTYTILINGHNRRGEINRAIEVFNNMNASGCLPDEGAYCSLIKGLCGGARVLEALMVTYSMYKRGLVPSGISYHVIIYHLCQLEWSDLVFRVFREMVFHGSKLSISNQNRISDVLWHNNMLAELDQVHCVMVKKGKRLMSPLIIL